MTGPGAEVCGLTVSYGSVQALRDVSVCAPRGVVTALLGPNGAGKSTLVGVLAGLKRPDAGTVRVAGIDVLGDPRRARSAIGYAAQDLAVYPLHTVRENLVFFGRLAGLSAAAVRRRTDELAGRLGLGDLLGRRTGTLSGGQQRRVHTACALLHTPPVVLLDEPTVGADVQTRAQIVEVVRDLAAAGATVLYCTHYLGEVEQVAARVVVLAEGRIATQGTLAELLDRSAVPAVRIRFDGPLPDVQWPGATVDGGELVLPVDGPGAVPRVVAALGADGARITSVAVDRPTLDDAYLQAVAQAVAQTAAPR